MIQLKFRKGKQMVLNVENFAQYFEERLSQLEQNTFGTLTGQKPIYPVMIVYLGEKTADIHEELSRNLFHIWSQYRSEIAFLQVKRNENQWSYQGISTNNNFPAGSIQENQLKEITSALFDANLHYLKHTNALIYYIMDSSEIKSGDEFNEWFTWMQSTENYFGLTKHDYTRMMILLLNDDFGHTNQSKEIREQLCKKLDEESILLLSNRRLDGAILSNWNECNHIIANIVVLSDDQNKPSSTGNIFSSGVKTVSYARVEKPTSEIGKIIMDELLQRLTLHGVGKITIDDKLLERLGVTKKGTFLVLDDYIEQQQKSKLPSKKDLELFPRMDESELDLSGLTAQDMNKYSMGAWEIYLNQIANQVEQSVLQTQTLRETLKNKYQETLLTEFTVEEMIELEFHINAIREKVQVKKPYLGIIVLESAMDTLKYKLGMNSNLTNIFWETIQQQSNQAKKFRQAWNNLLDTRKNMFIEADANMNVFYRNIVDQFWKYDSNGEIITKKFKRMRRSEEIEEFLKGVINQIINFDGIFMAPFEEELEKRLNNTSNPMATRNFIRDRLTGTGLDTYFMAYYTLGMPFLSAILMKRGTPLYEFLSNNLLNEYYYNTGHSNAAETIRIYRLSEDNLRVN